MLNKNLFIGLGLGYLAAKAARRNPEFRYEYDSRGKLVRSSTDESLPEDEGWDMLIKVKLRGLGVPGPYGDTPALKGATNNVDSLSALEDSLPRALRRQDREVLDRPAPYGLEILNPQPWPRGVGVSYYAFFDLSDDEPGHPLGEHLDPPTKNYILTFPVRTILSDSQLRLVVLGALRQIGFDPDPQTVRLSRNQKQVDKFLSGDVPD